MRISDWSSDVCSSDLDGSTLDLGALVTLANGNGTGFPQASTNVVAERLNKETGEVEPIDIGTPLLARCWPRGTTSDVSSGAVLVAQRSRAGMPAPAPPAMVMANARENMVSARKVVEEQLGDLKL